MILDICREWGQPPSWFYSLDRNDQVRLLGYWRARIPRKKTRVGGRVKARDRKAEDFWFGG